MLLLIEFSISLQITMSRRIFLESIIRSMIPSNNGVIGCFNVFGLRQKQRNWSYCFQNIWRGVNKSIRSKPNLVGIPVQCLKKKKKKDKYAEVSHYLLLLYGLFSQISGER